MSRVRLGLTFISILTLPFTLSHVTSAEQLSMAGWCESLAEIEEARNALKQREKEQRRPLVEEQNLLKKRRDILNKKLPDIESSVSVNFQTSALGTFKANAYTACAKEVAEEEAIEQKKREYQEYSGIAHLFLGSMRVNAIGEYTDNESTTGGPGVDIPLDLEKEQFVANVKVGWFNKPFLRDAKLLFGEDDMREYRKMKNTAWRWAWYEAVTVHAWFSYGTQLIDEPGDDNFKTETGTNFSVGINYSLPLERVFETWIGEAYKD